MDDSGPVRKVTFFLTPRHIEILDSFIDEGRGRPTRSAVVRWFLDTAASKAGRGAS